MTTCPYCGATMRDTLAMCPSCLRDFPGSWKPLAGVDRRPQWLWIWLAVAVLGLLLLVLNL